MRKLLNSLYILEETAYLTLDGENIMCRAEDSEKFRVPFTNIEDIYIFSYSGCSPALMGKCAEYGIAVNFISPQGKFLARVQGKTKGNVYLRKEQFELFSIPQLDLIRNTVAAKLSNTRYLIRRSLHDNPDINSDGALTDCIKYLENGIKTVYETADKDIIMGIEGSCAKAYFDIFDRLILHQKEDFYLANRTKRPPLDRVNAMLSFLYTIAISSYTSALESVGLDSCLGFYHALRSGRSSLSCDLVEEFRCVVERLVLTMINSLSPAPLSWVGSCVLTLTAQGKKKVLTAWQERKRTSIVHPYLGEKIQQGLLPYVQSSLLAKYIRGELDEYPNYLLK